MKSKIHEIGKRCCELQAGGKTFPEMVPLINREHPERTWKASTLSKYASQYRKASSEDKSESPAPLPGERGESSEQAELSAWEARMRTIAREVVEEAIRNTGNIPPAMDETADMPPQPETVRGKGKGRRETRKAEKISAMVDKNLLRLFEEERKRRHLSTGKLLDAILWRHYGRPQLSYESASDTAELPEQGSRL